MKQIYLYCILLFTVQSFAQNNPIFQGGQADGTGIANVLQDGTAIYQGGIGDGNTLKASVVSLIDTLFKGGIADGSAVQKSENTQVDTLFKGGIADGSAVQKSGNALVDTLFAGGIADGIAVQKSENALIDTLFNGGIASGWNTNNTTLANIDNIFKGGDGDGWSPSFFVAGPLPLLLFSFEAKKTNTNQVLLTWETALDNVNSIFTIQRSNNAKSFENIGIANKTNLSSQINAFEWVDNNPLSKQNYYRLKETNPKGEVNHSTIKVVFINQDGTFEIRPNTIVTASTTLYEIGDFTIQKLTVFNTQGAKLFSLESDFKTLNVSKIPKGIYMIEAISTDGRKAVKRFVKQN